jgi:hypothetical protein
MQVQAVIRAEYEPVTGRLAQYAVRTHDLAQPGHVDLHHLDRSVRQVLAPQVLEETFDRHRSPCVEQQARQHGALLAWPEREQLPPVARLERAEHSEVHSR